MMMMMMIMMMMMMMVMMMMIKIDADNDLSQEEMLTFHNVMIVIKSVLDKNQNHYYCNIFLEKCSYQSA